MCVDCTYPHIKTNVRMCSHTAHAQPNTRTHNQTHGASLWIVHRRGVHLSGLGENEINNVNRSVVKSTYIPGTFLTALVGVYVDARMYMYIFPHDMQTMMENPVDHYWKSME